MLQHVAFPKLSSRPKPRDAGSVLALWPEDEF